jgi:hypothetical protein
MSGEAASCCCGSVSIDKLSLTASPREDATEEKLIDVRTASKLVLH